MAYGYGQDIDDLLRGLKLRDEDFSITVYRDATVIREIIAVADFGSSYKFDYSKPYTTAIISTTNDWSLFPLLSGVFRIAKIENPFLYAAYLLKKQQKGSRASEVTVFHGTRIENVESICQNNLNYRLRGRYGHLGNKYGNGVSFSPKLGYAKSFPRRVIGAKAMFLVKVIQTNCCTGSLGLEIPPKGYDSSLSPDRAVLVKYSDNEFYPTHVAYYNN